MTDLEIVAKYRDVLTTKQLCEQYPFLNPGTMRYLRHKNEGPKSWTVGKKVVYARADVEAWLAEQEQATTRGGAA
ncbi:helix-turn-helix domain-containing protein [Gordonia sp. NB41Y]|uniref:helix-turn-helix transcriptional regulator n=1 Tax=Gordonia sp. NB41Y TaxID=875808 RepID=UPI0006B155C8|nr:helix-turn-helix domain-containing protein [Gordonia sp. NB41Y]KOY49021.1 hypothetical protein ISGA_12900 [Gordonia sp. NB41Y]WLP90074.1 helix-turn-helix domain-containing protein [Gordonia sp. NB41Y]